MGKPLAGQAGPACTEAIEETYPYARLRYDVTEQRVQQFLPVKVRTTELTMGQVLCTAYVSW